MNSRLHQSFFWATNVIIAIALVWGFILAGSPGTERQRKFDERRMSDLGTIRDEIIASTTQWVGNNRTMKRDLPKTLEEAQSIAEYRRLNIMDPETGAPYEYFVTDTSRFELCATFNFARSEQYDVAWDHEAGRQCFIFDALSDANGPIRKPLPLED